MKIITLGNFCCGCQCKVGSRGWGLHLKYSYYMIAVQRLSSTGSNIGTTIMRHACNSLNMVICNVNSNA